MVLLSQHCLLLSCIISEYSVYSLIVRENNRENRYVVQCLFGLVFNEESESERGPERACSQHARELISARMTSHRHNSKDRSRPQPVSPSVPEMEGIYMQLGGIQF